MVYQVEEVFTDSGAATVDEMVQEEDAELVFCTSNKEYGEAVAKAFEAKYGVSVTVVQEGMNSISIGFRKSI